MLLHYGVFDIRLGRFDEGLKLLHLAEALFEQLNDLYGQDICATNESAAAFYRGDFMAAKVVALRNLKFAQALNSQVGLGFAFANLGRAERELGELPQAIEHMQAGVAVRRTLGDPGALSVSMSDLVIAHLRSGDLEAARQTTQEMLALHAAAAGRMPEPEFRITFLRIPYNGEILAAFERDQWPPTT